MKPNKYEIQICKRVVTDNNERMRAHSIDGARDALDKWVTDMLPDCIAIGDAKENMVETKSKMKISLVLKNGQHVTIGKIRATYLAD